MKPTRSVSSLFAGLFGLLFIALMAVSGCSTGELVGPDSAENPPVESYRPDPGDPGHNDARNGGSNGGSTDPPGAGHNETAEDADMHN